jgi:DNA primase
MARIRQDDIETVRERTDIVALVQQFVGLKKAGRSYTGLCPFHTEKTPSFTVDPGKQVYYCFGCGVGGNAYHFLMAVENLTFPEAVERLAGQSGIQLHYEGVSPDERRASARRQALFHANEEAATLYHEHLLTASEAGDARRYLSGRGISKESVEEFRIGFSPDRSDFLLRRLARRFSPDILIEAGLALKDGRGSVRDRFRGRVMFPVHSLSGQAVGFGARLLKGEGPKYLNSPETPVYRKGEMLYNLHRAKAEVTSTTEAFVVEGYTDVIGLHQGGLPTGVATCGTALGEGHFRLLARFAKRVVLAFDSDEAGARAAERAYEFFEQYPVEALVLVLPEGSDPADIALDKGVDEFRELASGAVPLVEYMIRRRLLGHDLEGPEGQTRAVQDALPIVAGLGDPVRRERYSGMLADLTGVSASTVLLELDRPVPGERAPSRAARPAPARKEPRSPEREVEKEALKLLVQQADTAEEYMTQIGDDHFSTERARKVLGFLREGRGSVPDLVERARERGLGEAIAELAVEAPKGDPASGYTERVFSRLQEFFLTRQITTMKKRLERLNPTKDPNAYDALFGELMALEGERRSVRARAGEGA